MLFQVTIPIASNLGNSVPTDLGPYVSNIVGALLIIAAIAALIFLVMGGINWITAGGDTKKIDSARDRITGALIGLAVVAVSWALFLIIDNFLGIGIAGKTSSTGDTSSTASTGSTSSTVGGIGFSCMPTSQCNAYCPNTSYYTVRNSSLTCGANTIGCACVNKANPKVNPCPAGLTCT